MSIQPDIVKAIEILDQRIKSLQEIRDNLAREFGMNDYVKPSSPPKPDAQMPLLDTEAKTSKDKIADYLRTHGPASRKEITVETGIAMGTVSYALNDKKRFVNSGNGWVNRVGERLIFPIDSDIPQPPPIENKTDAVRRLFRERGTQGLTPGELKARLDDAGITMAVYGVIARLKGTGEIKDQGGRYYATEKLVPTSAQGLTQ